MTAQPQTTSVANATGEAAGAAAPGVAVSHKLQGRMPVNPLWRAWQCLNRCRVTISSLAKPADHYSTNARRKFPLYSPQRGFGQSCPSAVRPGLCRTLAFQTPAVAVFATLVGLWLRQRDFRWPYFMRQ